MSAPTIAPVVEVQTEVKAEPSLADLAIAAIVKETHYAEKQAAIGFYFIRRMVEDARDGSKRGCDKRGIHHLTPKEMSEFGYEVMHVVMGHGRAARRGTAHAAIEKALLLPDELGLIHDNRSPMKLRQDCVVEVTIKRVA